MLYIYLIFIGNELNASAQIGHYHRCCHHHHHHHHHHAQVHVLDSANSCICIHVYFDMNVIF